MIIYQNISQLFNNFEKCNLECNLCHFNKGIDEFDHHI